MHFSRLSAFTWQSLNLLVMVPLLTASRAIAVAADSAMAEATAGIANGSRLYVGHDARLTAEIPADWQPDMALLYDYAGPDGFIFSHSLDVSPMSLDTAVLKRQTITASRDVDSPKGPHGETNPPAWSVCPGSGILLRSLSYSRIRILPKTVITGSSVSSWMLPISTRCWRRCRSTLPGLHRMRTLTRRSISRRHIRSGAISWTGHSPGAPRTIFSPISPQIRGCRGRTNRSGMSRLRFVRLAVMATTAFSRVALWERRPFRHRFPSRLANL